MRRLLGLLAVLLGVTLSMPGLWAADPPASAGAEQMGPMGPPDEIKQLAHMAGTWDAQMRVRMDPSSEWMSFAGIAKFTHVAGGACLQMDYESQFMGMPFEGVAHTSFNRETGEWTDTWVDNVGGAMSIYTGKMVDGKKVQHGKDYMQGQVWLSRATTSEMKPDSYKWQLEHSTDDGKSWAVYMTIDYTKRVK